MTGGQEQQQQQQQLPPSLTREVEEGVGDGRGGEDGPEAVALQGREWDGREEIAWVARCNQQQLQPHPSPPSSARHTWTNPKTNILARPSGPALDEAFSMMPI